MVYLLASTTQVLAVGPFLDITDGATPEDALTVTNMRGQVHKYYPSGTAPAVMTFTPSATSTYTVGGNMEAIASASGMYTLVLTPSLTNWRGSGKLVLMTSSTALPYWDDVFCATTSWWLAMNGTAYAPANILQINGDTAATATAMIGVNVVNMGGAALSTANAQVGVNVVNMGGAVLSTANAQVGVNVVNMGGSTLATNAAQVGVNLVNVAGAALNTAVAQIGANVVNMGGAVLSTANAQVGVNVVNMGGSVLSTANAQVGVNLVNIAGAAVNTAAAQIGANVVGIASTGSQLTAVPWNASWAAFINAEVVDTLATDTYAEPGAGAPTATLPLANKLSYLYTWARNKQTVTATAAIVYADDGATPIQKSVISDDGTTFTKGELGAP